MLRCIECPINTVAPMNGMSLFAFHGNTVALVDGIMISSMPTHLANFLFAMRCICL